MRRLLLPLLALAASASVAAAQPLGESELGDQRGGLATPMGLDIGFGASVRTYVDGTLALETQLSWTDQGAHTETVFDSGAGAGGAPRPPGSPVVVAPGVQVIHDLSGARIASIVLSSASDRTIRQDTDVTLHLPQLPDLQQRIAAERLTQSLQAVSPQAAGLGN